MSFVFETVFPLLVSLFFLVFPDFDVFVPLVFGFYFSVVGSLV